MTDETKSVNIDVKTETAVQAIARFKAEAVKMQADVAKATAEAAKQGAVQVAMVKMLEKEQRAALTTAGKTAYKLEELRAVHVEGAHAADLQKKALDRLESKLADQTKRELANKGRSLSMLFDEQNKILSQLPGTIGQVSAAFVLLREGQDQLAEGLKPIGTGLTKLTEALAAQATAMVASTQAAAAKAAAETAAAVATDAAGDQAAETAAANVAEAVAAQKAAQAQTAHAAASAAAGEAGKATVGMMAALGAAGVAVAGAFAALGHVTAMQIDQIDELAQGLGLSAQELSRFQVVAGKVGGIEVLGKGLAKLTKLQSDAAAGGKQQQEILDQLGITAQTTAEEAMVALADAYDNAGTAQEKARLLSKAFGDELALKMAPAVAGGSGELRRLIADSERFGLTISEDSLKATQAYTDALDELGSIFRGLAKTIGETVVPWLAQLAIGLKTGVLLMTDGSTAAAQYLASTKKAAEGVADVGKALEEAAPKQEAAVTSQAKAVDNLAESVRALVEEAQPLVRVQRETEEALAILDRGLARGLITMEDYTAVARSLAEELNKAQEAAGLLVEEQAATLPVMTATAQLTLLSAEHTQALADAWAEIPGAVEDSVDVAGQVAAELDAAAQASTAMVTASLAAVGQVAQATGAGIAAAMAQGLSAIIAADSAAAALGSTLALVLGVARAVGARFDELSQTATGMGFREAAQTERGAQQLTQALEDIRWDDVAQQALEAFGRGFRAILVNLPSIISELLAGATQALAGAQGQGLIGQIAVDLIVALAKGLPPLMIQIARSFWVGIFKAAREFYGALGDLLREALSRALEALGLDRAAARVEGGGGRQRVGDITLPPGPSRVLETSPGDAVHVAQSGGPGDMSRLLRQQNGLLETMIGLQRQQLTESAELRRTMARGGRPMGMTPTLA